MTNPERTARTMWALFERIHTAIYFTPESLQAFEQAGMRGFWRGYFAGRAAPLGTASAAVVTASFYNFAPAFVARAIPGVWDLISPERACQVRQDGAAAALRRELAGVGQPVRTVADLLWQAAGGLDCAGRVLAAGNAVLPAPEDDFARLWLAATLLREHRGDGHFAALTAADIDGCEATVIRCAMGRRREDMQRTRGWTDDQWEAAQARLTGRGLLAPDGTITDAGRDSYAAVEEATDRAAARPWARLGPGAAAELTEHLAPMARACARPV